MGNARSKTDAAAVDRQSRLPTALPDQARHGISTGLKNRRRSFVCDGAKKKSKAPRNYELAKLTANSSAESISMAQHRITNGRDSATVLPESECNAPSAPQHTQADQQTQDDRWGRGKKTVFTNGLQSLGTGTRPFNLPLTTGTDDQVSDDLEQQQAEPANERDKDDATQEATNLPGGTLKHFHLSESVATDMLVDGNMAPETSLHDSIRRANQKQIRKATLALKSVSLAMLASEEISLSSKMMQSLCRRQRPKHFVSAEEAEDGAGTASPIPACHKRDKDRDDRPQLHAHGVSRRKRLHQGRTSEARKKPRLSYTSDEMSNHSVRPTKCMRKLTGVWRKDGWLNLFFK